ncbi:MAG TPA: hypothetical protein VL307_05105, partial [Chitinophagaceae bacterium]|nr:hypothetical protein [Chitinophagaceae bacterium]
MGKTMQRRQFLQRLSAKSPTLLSPITEENLIPVSSAGTTKASGTASGVNMYTGPWTEKEMVHLLKRVMFGATKASVDEIKGMSMSAAVDYLIDNPVQPSTSPVNNYTQGVDSGGVAFGASWIDAKLPDPVDPPPPAA